ncbi:hypothetical protein AB0395_42195 [Streptosporangium sp. NPDC051023]|uniref:hypothetical protein n=1 Tax=Streptosporangium sp. NPDC051023 TaxID=3155410 RepID=UPI00344E9559
MIGLRASREPGRHRDGQSPSVVHRRVWDGPARAEAEQLDQKWPDWTVLYSLGNRRFYAVAAWPSPHPVIVEHETATGLEAQMYEAEMTRNAQPTPAPVSGPVSAPPPDRRGGAPSQAPAAAPHHPYPSRRSHRRAA